MMQEGSVAFFTRKETEAAAAAESNDTKKLYAITKQLRGYTPKSIPALRFKDGSLAHSPTDIARRRQE